MLNVVAESATKTSMTQVVKGVAPFLLSHSIVLLLMLFFPALVIVPARWPGRVLISARIVLGRPLTGWPLYFSKARVRCSSRKRNKRSREEISCCASACARKCALCCLGLCTSLLEIVALFDWLRFFYCR